MGVATSDRYPTALPVDPRIVDLLTHASHPHWSTTSHFTFPRAARARAEVVAKELQYRLPLAGSSLAGQDDLWWKILEFAIARGE